MAVFILRILTITVFAGLIPSQGNLANEYLIADQTGSKLFVFDQNGRHQRTINALTGSEIYTFAYNLQGQLAAGRCFWNLTTIERDVDGKPIEIVAPGGQKTYLSRKRERLSGQH